MKRNLDLWRETILIIEEKHTYGAVMGFEPEWLDKYNSIVDLDEKNEKYCEIRDQVLLMLQAELIYGVEYANEVDVKGITPKGYDFIDSIRSKDVWEQTKDTSKKIGGGTVEFIKELGIGFLKTKVKEHTGIEM